MRGFGTRVLPTIIWLLALVCALQLYLDRQTPGVLTGHAEAQSVTISYLDPCVVRSVYVQLHDPVDESQLLVVMDDSEERVALASVRKDIKRLTAEVAAERARLVTDNALAEADVEDLTRRFLLDREKAQLDYLALALQEATDRILLRGATVDYEIIRGLHESGSAPFRELNDALTERDALRAGVESREPLLAETKLTFAEADKRWARFVQHTSNESTYDRLLDPLRLAIEVRQSDVEELVRRIDAHVLRSPIVGQVTSVFTAAGLLTQAGTPLLTISAQDTNRVVAYLPAQSAFLAQEGDKVVVQPLALSNEMQQLAYAGVVTSLSAIVDEIPLRARHLPSLPEWGRALVISIDESIHLTPGEEVRVTLPRQR